ncbi:MAG: endoribonuclease YbeY [Actinomycetota bacterium]|jgi:probable rRNA maturation factor|nr:MAG: endoribonuclease YbeY [Actinomycetota bacterium]
MSDADPSDPAVLVSDRQTEPIDIEDLVELARTTLRGEGVDRAELSLSFVEEAEIAALHERFLGEPGPTDVLSFPLDPDDVDERGVRVLGDVVVAPSVAARNRPDDPHAELRLLVVHGILHLLGHDHDDDAKRAEMWARQERYSGVRSP